ncbi:helix-turn-helix domain-containing protein [Pedobacter glucosidilyticus]|uniref:helix-turn-helix domain-containing protein n=1 Tax=Pedobacter glucosidilyticus TaxID=1122941 RepID=UPI00047C02FD
MLQKQIASEVNIPYTSYNKVENGTREITIDELERFAGFFGMTIDQVVHFNDRPVEVTIQDRPNFEQVNLISQLDEEDRNVVFKIIDTMLTKKKFKDFFNSNVAAL